MSKLMADISSGKVAYQAYTIEHGIEHVHIRIPLKESKSFERELNTAIEAGDHSKKNLMSIVTSHGGSLRKKV